MFPLRSSSSGGSAHLSGGDSTPQQTHRRAAAVGGGYDVPRQQSPPQQFAEQKNLQQSASVESLPAALSGSGRSAGSFQLLGMEAKRAAIAAYPSASEVLLRHPSSKNSPLFRPRPQSPTAAPRERVTVGDAAPASAVAFPHPTAGAAASTATMFRGTGPYVVLPLRNTTGSVLPRIYPQGAYAVPPRQGFQQQQYQQQFVRQQIGQQGLVAGQPQRQMYGQYPAVYPTPAVLYQQQQRQHPMHQYPYHHPTQGVRTQQLQKQYSAPQVVQQKQMQHHHSLLELSGKTEDTPPRRLKSALRSGSSSEARGPPHGILKSGSSVRFALEENEVFRGEDGVAHEKGEEGTGVMPSATAVGQGAADAAALQAGAMAAAQRSPGATAGSTAAVAALDKAVAALPVAGAAATVAGEPRTEAAKTGETTTSVAAAAKAPPGAKGEGPPPVQTAAAKTPEAENRMAAAPSATRKEEVQVGAATVAGNGLEPAGTPAAVGAAVGPAGKQQEGGGGRAPGGVDTEKGQAELMLLYRSLLAATGTESPSAAASTSRAGGSGTEARQIGSDKAFQKAESRPQVQAESNHQPPEKSRSTQDVAAPVGAGGRGGSEEQRGAQNQQQQQLERQGIEQQQALQQPKDSGPKEQQTEAPPVPCLCVGHADHPHVCINFSASFQPKLLVRRSCAPALHIYAERQLPVKDYFVVPSTMKAAKGKAAAATAALAPAAATANSKKMPEGAAPPPLTRQEGTTESPAEQHTTAQEDQETKGRSKLRKSVSKTEEATSASSDTSATGVSGVPLDDTAGTEKVFAATGGAAAASRDASAGDRPHETETERSVERTAEEREAHGLSRRDWMMSNVSFSPSVLRSFSGLLRSGSLSLDNSEKSSQERSRRGSSMSTDDGLSVDEQEWRWKMAQPTIILHRPFHKRVEPEHPQTEISPEAASGGAAAAADAGGKNQRVLVVVDTTTEWWPSVQVRWLDAKKEEMQQQERQTQQVHEQNRQRTMQQQKSGNADKTQDVEDESLMQKGLPTNCSGICMWSNHRPTLLDLRV